MVSNSSQSLSRPVKTRLYDKDLTWLEDHGVEISSFLRELVHARITYLRGTVACGLDPAVQIISYSGKHANAEKKDPAPPVFAPPRMQGPTDAMSQGDIVEQAAWSEETAYII